MLFHDRSQSKYPSHGPSTESSSSIDGTEANSWTPETIKFLKIKTVARNDPVKFFGKPLPLKPEFVDPDYEVILNYEDPADLPLPRELTVKRLLCFLQRLHCGHILANKPPEIVSNQIIEIIFQSMGYENPSQTHIVAIQEWVHLCILDEYKDLKIGTVIMDINTCLIYLISEQLGCDDQLEGESKFFARAIAVAQRADKRSRLLGRPRRKKTIVLGILLIGSFPIFYIIPVSSELVDAAQEMREPTHETTVYNYRPRVLLRHWCAGLWRKESRLPILCAFEAFKAFLPAHADDIPDAWIPYMQDTDAATD